LVVRDPARYADPWGPGVHLVAGDVTDGDSVAHAAAGHDAAVSAVYDAAVPPDVLYTGLKERDRGWCLRVRAGWRRFVMLIVVRVGHAKARSRW